MTFSETLKQYMSNIPCSASELSAVSGLAPSMISRYLRCEQIPGDKAIRKLAAGLDFLSRDKGGPSLDYTKVSQNLTESLYGICIDYSLFIKNLHRLLSVLNVNNNEIAKTLNFDPSYISRILSGTRKPANLYQFLTNISDYITNRFFGTPYISIIAETTECDAGELTSREILSFTVRRYLGSHTDPASEIMPRFLVKLDSFDLNDYQKLERSNIPAPAGKISSSGSYFGLAALKQAYLDFIDLTFLHGSGGTVVMFMDLPFDESSEPLEMSDTFSEKLMRLINKGFTVNIIHNVHRSFGELLSELLQWMPFYMTGKVRPYYISEPTNHIFMHILCSSGSASLSGEAVFGNPNGCRCVLSEDLADINYVKERAQDLLSHAHPLMDIYAVNRRDDYARDKWAMFLPGGNYTMIRSVPPLFCMSESLLERILRHHEVPEKDAAEIRKHYSETREAFEKITAEGSLQIDLPEDREDETLYLPLLGLFRSGRIPYTDSEYAEHVRDLHNYAAQHPSVSVTFRHKTILKNTAIMISSGRGVLISKSNAPEIHFTIYYPSLVRAFESFAETYVSQD